MIQKGDVLDGKYEILMLRGRGGMSKVWLATDRHINKQWAIKEIDKKSKEYKSTVDEGKTLREVEIMKRLDHPSLPRIVDIIDKEDSICIVMDYVDGESLHEIQRNYERPSEETIVSWMLDVCDTLIYLHSFDPPIIYRDMKPSNIMLTRDQRIKIIDFGIAKDFKDGYEDTQPLGTKGYASPEHFSKHTDVRSDVYTVGTTMYQLLTKKDPSQPPYYMVPIREIDPDLSSGLEKIILKATEKDPDDRYQSVAELANAIESYKSLEQEHIDKLEKKEKNLKAGFGLGGFFLFAGIVLTVLGLVISSKSYRGLVETTPGTAQAEKNYIAAIEIEPSKPDAYDRLLSEYIGDGQLTDEELSKFTELYEPNKKSLSKDSESYSNINYKTGEGILTYYRGSGDSSARAKVLKAEPFFSEVTEGEHKDLAANYVFIASFYRDYIMADSSLVVKGATKGNLTNLLESCEDAVDSLQESDFSGRAKMKEIVFDFVLTALGAESSDMSSAGIKRNGIDRIIRKIEADEEISPEVSKLAKETTDSVNIAYSKKKKAS